MTMSTERYALPTMARTRLDLYVREHGEAAAADQLRMSVATMARACCGWALNHRTYEVLMAVFGTPVEQ